MLLCYRSMKDFVEKEVREYHTPCTHFNKTKQLKQLTTRMKIKVTALVLVLVMFIAMTALVRAQDGEDFVDFGSGATDEPDPASALQFQDISSSGTLLNLGDDDHATIPLPFGFNFYGRFLPSGTPLYVSSNGFLTFGNSGQDSFTPQRLPDPMTPNAVIAGWWSDLDPSSAGSVRSELTNSGTRLVVQWTNVPYFGRSSTSNTFQIVLRQDSNNCAYFNYRNVDSVPFTEAAAGTENWDGTEAYVFGNRNFPLRDRSVFFCT